MGSHYQRHIDCVASMNFIFGETDAPEQRTNDAGVPHRGDDVRTETNGSDVQPPRKSGG